MNVVVAKRMCVDWIIGHVGVVAMEEEALVAVQRHRHRRTRASVDGRIGAEHCYARSKFGAPK